MKRWPIILASFLFAVIAVNLVFLYVAVSGQDTVVPSYVDGDR